MYGDPLVEFLRRVCCVVGFDLASNVRNATKRGNDMVIILFQCVIRQFERRFIFNYLIKTARERDEKQRTGKKLSAYTLGWYDIRHGEVP